MQTLIKQKVPASCQLSVVATTYTDDPKKKNHFRFHQKSVSFHNKEQGYTKPLPHDVEDIILSYLGLRYILPYLHILNDTTFYRLCMDEINLSRNNTDKSVDFTSYIVWDNVAIVTIFTRLSTIMDKLPDGYFSPSRLSCLQLLFCRPAHYIFSHDKFHDQLWMVNEELGKFQKKGLGKYNNDVLTLFDKTLNTYLKSMAFEIGMFVAINYYFVHNVNCYFCGQWDLSIVRTIGSAPAWRRWNNVSFYLSTYQPSFKKKRNFIYGLSIAESGTQFNCRSLSIINQGDPNFKWSTVRIPITGDVITLNNAGLYDIRRAASYYDILALRISQQSFIPFTSNKSMDVAMSLVRQNSLRLIQNCVGIRSGLYDLSNVDPSAFTLSGYGDFHVMSQYSALNGPLSSKILFLKSFIKFIKSEETTKSFSVINLVATYKLPFMASLKGTPSNPFSINNDANSLHQYIDLDKCSTLQGNTYYIYYCIYRTNKIEISLRFTNEQLEKLTEYEITVLTHTLENLIKLTPRSNYNLYNSTLRSVTVNDPQLQFILVTVRNPYCLGLPFPMKKQLTFMREDWARTTMRKFRMSRELGIRYAFNTLLLSRELNLAQTNVEAQYPTTQTIPFIADVLQTDLEDITDHYLLPVDNTKSIRKRQRVEIGDFDVRNYTMNRRRSL